MHTPLSAVIATVLVASCSRPNDDRPTRSLPTATPESVRLDAKVLSDLDADIAGGKLALVDSMLVVRHGKIAYDRSYRHDYDATYAQQIKEPGLLRLHDPAGPYNYFNPWWHPLLRRGDLHTMQSVTKSVLSVTIGAATARGEFPSLDTPILKFFDQARVANLDERKRRITIRHLLTMTAGFDWHEDLAFADEKNSAHQMEASYDWAAFVVDRPMQYEPGTVFHYSSGVAQLAADVFQRATGHDVEEYAATHVLAPLGIDQFYWKRTPTGQANTEGGLYLRPRDLAKIGVLFANGGVWEGRRIVPAEWVRESVAPAAGIPGRTFKYGYMWWLFPYGDGSHLAWVAWGWGGQYLIIVPELDLVAVFTGWNIVSEKDKPLLKPQEAIERVVRAVKAP
jgi:CubicO group peptidase (beta-lactamase class C family)